VKKFVFFSVIIGHDEVNGILEEAKELLSNGICDFADECGNFQSSQRNVMSGILAFWRETGIVKRTKCGTKT
jgi:hypothetical protein